MGSLTSFLDWLLRFIKMDRSSRNLRKLLREIQNRRRYPVLTLEMLRSLDEFGLVDAVCDYVELKVDGNYRDELKIVSSLPRSFQAVYSTRQVDREVNNGGFYQYFYNDGIDWAFMALEGYKLMGAKELAALMARAIEIHLREESVQQQYRTENPILMVENYVEGHKFSELPELDRPYGSFSFYGVAIRYIQSHLEEFVAQ
jgi:hypothetical protein